MLVSPGITGLQRFDNGEPGTLAQFNVVAHDPTADGSVIRADATDITKAQVVGVAYRVFVDRAYVKTSGPVAGFSGLVRGSQYWVDPENPGGISAEPPELSGDVKAILPVGIALSSTELQVVVGTLPAISCD